MTAMFVSGTGDGLEPALQGGAAFLVDKAYIGMFTTIAFSDLMARIVGGPLISKLLFIGYEGTNRLEGLFRRLRGKLWPLFK
jgi:hypothetical protein